MRARSGHARDVGQERKHADYTGNSTPGGFIRRAVMTCMSTALKLGGKAAHTSTSEQWWGTDTKRDR